MRAVLDSARDDVGRVTVRTEIDDVRAIGWYESTGFSRGGRFTEHAGDGDVAVAELSRAP